MGEEVEGVVVPVKVPVLLNAKETESNQICGRTPAARGSSLTLPLQRDFNMRKGTHVGPAVCDLL